MYFVCECGESFDANQTGAKDHMINEHRDVVETRFEDFLDDAIEADDDTFDQEIWEDAIDDVVDELLDCFPE